MRNISKSKKMISVSQYLGRKYLEQKQKYVKLTPSAVLVIIYHNNQITSHNAAPEGNAILEQKLITTGNIVATAMP